ncbi:hypothetical protein [Haloarcula argentinensis]|uniref:Uncharacterized protein n=1 Tax=Haloarcula argentinensis TaxID=43776 RepID=A0ABU2F1L2_HALAR|nr:hypothetical protein [Haloarcula argentinensis]MDS0254428.1 hypothetical protein [Haloarcula argentinensis]
MNRNHSVAEVVVYILTTVAGALLLPIAVPVFMWWNGHGYADEYLWLSDIQSGNGLASGLTPFVFVVVFAAPIHDIPIFASGGGTVRASSVRLDDSGPAASSTSKLMPTSTEVPIPLLVEEDNRDTDLNNETQEPW